ncbi:TonB-dependent receptor [Mangrovimicrobium sediminis]|uniref:TonB-dependent receptor n=1 Tax=Mangrovimicrobium sediminis TaxID=2562682 RepID=A0A4Z0LY75_9GAMM|nr:TonB-dependent receptor [Haliea sp. SAOS-164]TGD72292.1 TonB-dependent receptor [Haliea sp. SAOS-164]
MRQTPYRKRTLARAVSIATLPAVGLAAPSLFAQEIDSLRVEEVIVTASRRSESIQDIPINISAVSGDKIASQRLYGVTEIANYVPGLTVIDRGPRDEHPDILVRGLNTTATGPGFVSDTVASYFGDIPVTVDIKPVDLERVEVLIGPQGTLYGQGTMGGAIRYIPKLADATEFYGEARGNFSSNEESGGYLYDVGVTINLPIIENVLAVRGSLDQLDDPGFVDYNYVVREGGVSNPEPDFSNPEDVNANLKRVKDANGEESLAGRLNLRFTPNDWLDANLWYLYQDTEAEGRQLDHRLSFGTDKYESGLRYEEPNDYRTELWSLDVKIDIMDIAEATVIYGKTDFHEEGQRDQTDLLLDFEYGYEFFPSFSSYTREENDEETDTVEIRLVSTHGGPFSWVVGYFYNEFDQDAVSEEYTPGFDQFAVDEFGGVQLRPDALEYIELTDYYQEEEAFYGELSYRFLDDRMEVTVGYRDYTFDVDSTGGFGLPLFDTVFLGEPQDAINVDLGTNKGSNNGDLWKFNVAFDLDPDNMIYATYSEGYRNGGVNAVPECTPEQIESTDQQLCAQADEVFIDPDTIKNYELGYKGLLLDGRLSTTVAVYFIDWQDLQVSTTTDLGGLPIIGNGSEAESKGLEFQGSYLIGENWEVDVTYAYTNAELTEYAPGLVGPFDAEEGARLPGSPEHQGTFNLTYTDIVGDGIEMKLNYGFIYTGDVYNIVGGDDDPLIDPETGLAADYGGESIPSYDIHHLSASFSRDAWMVQAYVDNLFDDYYVTGIRGTRRFLQDEKAGPGNDINGFTLRSYAQYIGAPRTFGLRMTYSF